MTSPYPRGDSTDARDDPRFWEEPVGQGPVLRKPYMEGMQYQQNALTDAQRLAIYTLYEMLQRQINEREGSDFSLANGVGGRPILGMNDPGLNRIMTPGLQPTGNTAPFFNRPGGVNPGGINNPPAPGGFGNIVEQSKQHSIMAPARRQALDNVERRYTSGTRQAV